MGTSWSEQIKLTAWDGYPTDDFGYSVSIDGDDVIIGAFHRDNYPVKEQGKSYVYVRSGSSWSEQSNFIAEDAGNIYFGKSVSINGDYAIVGTGANFRNEGKAYIFNRSGNSWSEQALLFTTDDQSIGFGASVSINGDYAIVGVSGDASNAGKAYIYFRTGSSWSEQAVISASDGAANDHFGASVSIFGDYAIVGAYGHSNYEGKAYIFHRTGTSWSQQAILTASDGSANDYFAYAVSVYGDYAVIGASKKNTGGLDESGKAYIFNRNGTTWTQQAMLIASDKTAFDNFGHSVDIDSNYVVIGAFNKDVNGNSKQGKAYIFHRSGSFWSEQAQISASDGDKDDYFGESVSMQGEYIVVGASKKGGNGNTWQGKAYVFHRDGTNWSEITGLLLSNKSGGDHFGSSVSIYGDYIIVGAPHKDVVEEDGNTLAFMGLAYFYMHK